jgi:protein SCO1/2
MDEAPGVPRNELPLMQKILLALAALCGLLALGAGLLLVSMRQSPPGPPPIYPEPVPHFEFTNEQGAPFRSQEQLAGKVWVANFVFTRCPSICPMFSKKMAEIQKETLPLSADVRLVSFTVDPRFDTPPVLKEYGERYHAQPGFWTFLTGEHDALKKTIVTDLKIHMTDESDDIMAIAHGGHFVLLDRQMRMRGVYNSEDDDAVKRLVADLKLVVEESK